MARTYNPDAHKPMVDNWRRVANIPDSCNDRAIYNTIEASGLHYSSGQTDEENAENIAILRECLLLPAEGVANANDPEQ